MQPMQSIPIQSVHLYSRIIDFNNFCDKVPFISTATNLFNLSVKFYLVFQSEASVNEDPNFVYIKNKNIFRCVILLVPVLGNVAVYMYDRIQYARTLASLQSELSAWVNDVNKAPDEKRKEAAEKILFSFRSNDEYLFLSNLKLRSVPSAIRHLKNVNYLDLSNNNIEEFPHEILKLTYWKKLILHNNLLQTLPPEIEQLVNLQDLELGNNSLKTLPPQIGQLTRLTRLGLKDNELQTLPCEIGKLTNLKKIFLEYNPLKSLPEEFWQLNQLNSLYLSHNQITSLPPEIGQLTHLENLDVAFNKLALLPNQLGNLSKLKNLSIRYNSKLHSLPLSLGDISGMTHIDITGTQISQNTLATILNLCAKKREENFIYEFLARIQLWCTYAGKEKNSLNFIEKLPEQFKFPINEWLVRLAKTKDFQYHQSDLAEIVCGILKCLEHNQEFRDLFLVQVQANNECCEDRAAMSLNEIYTTWKLYTLEKEAPLEHKLKLLDSLARTITLRKKIAELLEAKDIAENVEIYLYYEKVLSQKLKFETAIKEMKYEGIGKCKWIKEADLINSVEKDYLTEMVQLPAFLKIAEADACFKQKQKKVDEEFTKKQVGLEDKNDAGNLSNGEYVKRFDEMQVDYQKALNEAAISWVKKQLPQN